MFCIQSQAYETSFLDQKFDSRRTRGNWKVFFYADENSLAGSFSGLAGKNPTQRNPKNHHKRTESPVWVGLFIPFLSAFNR